MIASMPLSVQVTAGRSFTNKLRIKSAIKTNLVSASVVDKVLAFGVTKNVLVTFFSCPYCQEQQCQFDSYMSYSSTFMTYMVRIEDQFCLILKKSLLRSMHSEETHAYLGLITYLLWTDCSTQVIQKYAWLKMEPKAGRHEVASYSYFLQLFYPTCSNF